jgi:hypothetical protein
LTDGLIAAVRKKSPSGAKSINDLINSSAFDRMNIQIGKEKETDG